MSDPFLAGVERLDLNAQETGRPARLLESDLGRIAATALPT